jgi:hypothetical protein
MLLFSSLVFSGTGSDKGERAFLYNEETRICLSFENYQMKDGWAPVESFSIVK